MGHVMVQQDKHREHLAFSILEGAGITHDITSNSVIGIVEYDERVMGHVMVQ